MTTDQAPDAASDAIRIDIADSAALEQWATKFDATADQIREAVTAVGPDAAAVEMHLKGTHATTDADQQARADALGDGGETP